MKPALAPTIVAAAIMTLPSQGAASVITFAGMPEPSNWALLIGGFGLVGAVARRRRSALA